MESRAITEGTLLWEPSEALKSGANVTKYMAWLKEKKGLEFPDYNALWQWSVTEKEDFWESLWEFFEIMASRTYDKVLEGKMPTARWFQGSELNYVEHVFRRMTSDHPALLFQSEITPLMEISWDELHGNVSSVAASLRDIGVKKGDRVASFMPNIPETLVAFLATASIGAIWSSCSPDFGTRSIIDRFMQIEPKILFAVDGYSYGGKTFERQSAVARLQDVLPSLEKTVMVPYLDKNARIADFKGLENVLLWKDLLGKTKDLVYEQVPFDHPIWVVYSSGTTGLPKGLVHGHGGILLEFLKFQGIQMDVHPGDRFFWFSTTGWVMWNIVQSSLLMGAIPVLFDGSPGYPGMDMLWDLAEKAKVTVFGTSAAFITACMGEGMKPGETHDLSSLKVIGSTGSPLSPEGFAWVYEQVKSDVWLASVSGGTDIVSGFLACSPILPVHASELQCRGLGIKAAAFDEEGNELLDQVGELVVTEPMPSMPLFLWNDKNNSRYLESYFDLYPGIWRHGDWIKFTTRGSAVILGRSDSTLNRQGVRMGSSEIYSVVEDLPEIMDSLIVGFEGADGQYHMPLFVVLKEDATLDDALKSKINKSIRSALSPRHVPDSIHAIAEIPHTLNGKKLEVPVKKILAGFPLEKAVNVDSMANPDSIEYFVEMGRDFAKKRR
ncbi:MAG TPA: acetoacetate--CoA ligase [Deltaproteobacteria bacterium]|nr:acetoacetate--CoA ligase [Deltaproteobacteria bacterium]HIJ39802.1 acetoacetate--CoA ligase [Deltaproteobacteria bacterium]